MSTETLEHAVYAKMQQVEMINKILAEARTIENAIKTGPLELERLGVMLDYEKARLAKMDEKVKEALSNLKLPVDIKSAQ